MMVPLRESVKAAETEADVEPAVIPHFLEKNREITKLSMDWFAKRTLTWPMTTYLMSSARASLLGMMRSIFFLSLSVRPSAI
jgi:hypothetical protein